MIKILVVDDDAYIRRLVSTILKDDGFEVYEAVDGRDALLKLDEKRIDLCVADIMMPNMDGLEFCRNARNYYKDMPILMLTAKSEIGSKIESYGSGADDYLTKPFEAEELLLRSRALLKRYKIASQQTIAIGLLTVDNTSHTVSANGERLSIPLREFELLFKLGSFPGKTLSRNQLIEDIWGFDFDGNERTLDVHVGRLRDRFPPAGFGFQILTIRSLGYRLEVIS
ncbi:response regulator transcription factor [Desulfosporosinus meridiei]|uniref:Heme response regulator HssR n=1 Tax=Desulfosporosinus meridiei (strain ATCC BAA-275 / DSM 13257 / KCTC 12902 / NCIMB 13706 / S10) TaxID=768704 RepID=J7IUV3_DESMD|nr:response regulator transcription factor [Desulfosporosinus meridiei]AFQ43929.1 response regulator with CheY-like receiver domain and winged-helix DNA-binding domain [Desulfosporosinus meridiei DSM 13257]